MYYLRVFTNQNKIAERGYETVTGAKKALPGLTRGLSSFLADIVQYTGKMAPHHLVYISDRNSVSKKWTDVTGSLSPAVKRYPF